MARIHRLKTWAPYFDQVRCGRKSFEVRRDDRGYVDFEQHALDHRGEAGVEILVIGGGLAGLADKLGDLVAGERTAEQEPPGRANEFLSADIVGGRMPRGTGPFLTDGQMLVIRRWIELGAKND